MVYPKVSIIIVTYLENNQPYLDMCEKSILNLNYPKDCLDVMVVSSGKYKPKSSFVNHHSDADMHWPPAVNLGVSKASADSKYFLILNDDVILSKDSLRNMVSAAGDGECIIGPVSNCDNFFKYVLTFGYEDEKGFNHLAKRFYRIDESKHFADKIMNSHSLYPPGAWKQEFVCFYATLFPRKVWEKIGGLDESFKTGCDDLDYCLRCKQHNIPVLIEQSAFIFHHGGTTADVVLDNDTRKYNDDTFQKKWGIHPFEFHR